MKRIAILQSNYIPWKGYFDLIDSVDEFILYDVVQYTRRDWRNRNKIITLDGLQWLTVPVNQKGNFFMPINEIKVVSFDWIKHHLNIISQNYREAEFYSSVYPIIENMYEQCSTFHYLSDINRYLITHLNDLLEINTTIRSAEEFNLSEDKNQKLLDICIQTSATHYLSGPSAQSYLDLDLFRQSNIQVEWMNYKGYREYNQLFHPYEHGVSILDLLLNVGIENARNYIKKDIRCLN